MQIKKECNCKHRIIIKNSARLQLRLLWSVNKTEVVFCAFSRHESSPFFCDIVPERIKRTKTVRIKNPGNIKSSFPTDKVDRNEKLHCWLILAIADGASALYVYLNL